MESADDSLPVDTAQGAGDEDTAQGEGNEDTAQEAGNNDDPSLPKHEDQGAAIPPKTTFADPSSLNAIDFTSSPCDDEHLDILPPPPSHPAVQDLRADGMRNQNTIDLTDVDDSEEVSVPPPVIKPDPIPDAGTDPLSTVTNDIQTGTDPSSTVTNDTQTENSGNDIKSTRNKAGGRYNLRNLVGKQYAQIQKTKKERTLFVLDTFKNITAICMTQMIAKIGNCNVRAKLYKRY